MKKSMFIHAKEVAQRLEISDAHAYKIIRGLNDELRNKGINVNL